MKMWFLFSTLLSLSAHAFQTKDLTGEYKYQGHALNVLAVQDREVVYAETAAGKTRLEKLTQKGFTCEAKPRTVYLCTQFRDDLKLLAKWEKKINKEAAKESVVFQELTDAPSLINDAPELQEWRVPQTVEYGGKEYAEYRFLILNQKLAKISLDGATPAEDITLLPISPDEIQIPKIYDFSTGERKSVGVLVGISLTR
jgi:hypothetical protein